MARIRQVKPELFDDPDLGVLPVSARWIFAGLFTQADREGRLVDDSRRLKTRLSPYDDIDIDAALTLLAEARLIIRYQVEGKGYVQIRTFKRHQHIHPNESPSVLPKCPDLELRRIAKENSDLRKVPESPGNIDTSKQGPASVTTSASTSASTSTSACTSASTSGARGSVQPPEVLRESGAAAKADADATTPTTPRAPERRGVQGHGVGAGTYPRDHLRCAQPCGRVCLPESLFVEFVKARGGPREAAESYVRTWQARVNAAWDEDGEHGAVPIGDDKFEFWRARWREDAGTTTTRSSALEQPMFPGTPTIEQQAENVRALLNGGRR